MASTIKDLKAMIADLPDDAIVEVIEINSSGYSSYGEFKPLDTDKYSDNMSVIDFRGDDYKDSKHFGKVFVQFGSN